MIARVAKRLENIVSISFVEPFVFDNGWTFAKPDPLTGVRYIHELYSQADPLFTGRATVPVLWDKETHTIINNESADIIRMFNREFDDMTDELTDYYPEALAGEIDQIDLGLRLGREGGHRPLVVGVPRRVERGTHGANSMFRRQDVDEISEGF